MTYFISLKSSIVLGYKWLKYGAQARFKKKEGVEVLKKTKHHYLGALIRIPSLNQHNSSIEHTCFSGLQIDVMLNIQCFKWFFYDQIC